MKNILIAILLSLSPVSELRGGLPYALSEGVDPLLSFIICVAANIIIIPLLFIFLSTLHKTFLRYKFYKRIFNRGLASMNKKASLFEKRYSMLGYTALTLFTAIPFPTTGAYTSTFIAWLLGLNKLKSGIAIAIGVIIAGIIVLMASLGVIKFLAFV